MREIAIDAEQFVTPCQPLPGGVGQHHDRPLRMRARAGQHRDGQGERMVHTDLQLVGGADYGDLAGRGGGAAGQHIVVAGDGVAQRKQLVE